jgi:prophage regulatory protein
MHDDPSTHTERLLRLKEVETRVGLRRSAIYAAIQRGTFPPGVKISARASAWASSAIDAWIADRIRAAGRQR